MILFGSRKYHIYEVIEKKKKKKYQNDFLDSLLPYVFKNITNGRNKETYQHVTPNSGLVIYPLKDK